MLLLIDIGNTRIKWASLIDGALGEMQARAHLNASSAAVAASLLENSAVPTQVWVSNVGGIHIGRALAEGVRTRWGFEATFVQSQASAGGVRNAYRTPHQLGVDRWLAMIGAHRLASAAAACIVSVGTAMTIDALAAGGRHLGGMITPGPDLMRQSLFRNTSDIAARAASGAATPDLFADNTLGAVEQGAVHALAALIERAVATLQARLGESPTLFITGGASAHVSAAITTPYRLVPDLVLRGLAVIAQERP